MKRVLWAMVLLGGTACAALIALRTPLGGAYVLPGSVLAIGACGLIATRGED